MSLELIEDLPPGGRAVTLAGRDFTIAPLSLRQILAIADHVPKLAGLSAENVSGERLTPLAEVVWHSLRRAHPKLSRDEFFDLPISIAELVAALPVVMEQAGGKKADVSAGEALPPDQVRGGRGASGSTNSTGESSSPTS